MQKRLILFVFSILTLLVGCSTNDDMEKDPIDGVWEVRNISGGFAGINDDYPTGIILWSFNGQQSKLTVTNNNIANTIYDGFESGEYPYSILQKDKVLYLEIDGQEFGGMVISQNELVIDQNITSSGGGADGFVLLLQK
ncbi:MAG: hypothetical protein GY931_08540 [Maribacter sp.]|nr:hypothetical protein [Maribacter sp.]